MEQDPMYDFLVNWAACLYVVGTSEGESFAV